MKTKEFNLSEKIGPKLYVMGKEDVKKYYDVLHAILVKDIKEFIKILKEVGKIRLDDKEDYKLFCEDIDKLAGSELI